MSNIVYVLTNEAMPGIVKIGVATGENPQARMNSLYSGNSSVPLPFECAIAIKVNDGQATSIERALHKAFEPDRLNKSREFFWTEVDRIKPILLAWPESEEVTPQVNEETQELEIEDREAVINARSRRPNLNFMEMGLSVSDTIKSIDSGETATVIGDRKVSFRGDEMYLTMATRKALDLKPEQNSVAPCPHWTYKGRNLGEIYEETYGIRGA